MRRMGHSRHNSLARSSSCGLSANHKSGSSARQGTSTPKRIPLSVDIVTCCGDAAIRAALECDSVELSTSYRHVVRVMTVDTSVSSTCRTAYVRFCDFCANPGPNVRVRRGSSRTKVATVRVSGSVAFGGDSRSVPIETFLDIDLRSRTYCVLGDERLLQLRDVLLRLLPGLASAQSSCQSLLGWHRHQWLLRL